MVRLCLRPFMALTLFVMLAAPLFGVAADIAGAVVLIAVGTEDGGTDTVRRVVVSSAELYLDQQGVIARESDARPPGGELPALVFEEADEADADFLLHGIVSLQGNEVTV